MSANSTYFNRYSSNISVDGALAVFDILPTDDIAELTGEEFTHAFSSVYGVNFLDADIRYFPIESSHCTKRSTAYYLNRKTTRYAEFPQVAGIPMNYGGAPLARYKALSEDIIEEEPLLLIPTLGMTHEYEDRAKSLEFWITFEPYAKNRSLNLFHDSIANLTPLDVTTYDVVSGNITKVTDATKYNSLRGSDTYLTQSSVTTTVDFLKPFILVGGRHYRFEVMLNNDVAGREITFTFTMVVGTVTKDIEMTFSPRNNDDFTQQFDTEFGQAGWIMYGSDFYVDELISTATTTLSLTANGALKFSELTLVDINQDLVETPTYKNKILEFGGKTQTSVVLSADAEFMYLEGYGQIANLQIGEWARPIYIVCVDNAKTFDVYVDCEQSLTITKNGTGTYGTVSGEWAVLYISPLFKYIDLSALALYGNVLGADIQRIHHMFSYGPKYNDVIVNTQHEQIYIADGSATSFSSQVLFPQLQSFALGEAHSVSMGRYLSLPDYQLPPIFNGSYDDAVITTVNEDNFGIRSFVLPPVSEISLVPRDVNEKAAYVFISVSPHTITSGTICRIQTNQLGHYCDIKMVPYSGGTKVTANLTYSNTDKSYIDYSEYYDRAPSYELDPNYQKKTYREVAGQADPWWTDTTNSLQDFTIILNIKELSNDDDVDISALFGDPSLEIRFIGDIPFSTIAVASLDSLVSNNILLEGETDLPGISMDHTTKGDDGFGNPIWEPVRQLLGNAEYTIYPNEDEIDIAATGYWYISIPLANFASYVTGNPDLDFIVYSDQSQSPQLVTSLSTDTMTYDEVDSWVDADLSDNMDGEYQDLQDYADAANPDALYGEIGLTVDTSIPSFGRFADSAIQTYVTLDSPIRWPYKQYSDLKVERASSRGFIDFAKSPNLVMDTKWEIFDGFGIRIPSNINIYKYNLGFSVHISSKSLNSKRPTFRRGEFFGVSSGRFASNQIAVGSGNVITIGDRNADINIYTPYSTHLSTESMPSNYFSREHGFFPHGKSDEADVHPVYFNLASSKNIAAVSMYALWRVESFRNDGQDELLGTFLYDDGNNNEQSVALYVRTDPSIMKKYQAANVLTSPSHNVYVDGSLTNQIDVNRWHLLQIELDLDSISERPVRFKLENERLVVNYVTSHSVNLSPTNLNASRFGTTDLNLFGDDFSLDIHYGYTPVATLEDIANGIYGSEGMVTSVKRPENSMASGASPDLQLHHTLDG